MRKISRIIKSSVLILIGVVVAAGVSCRQSSSGTRESSLLASGVQQNGRYQLVVAQQGERTMVFMVDTREGTTWFFQPPQGALINGFWSNIPRLTFGDQYWEQVMRQMLTPAQQPGVAGATGSTSMISTGNTTVPPTPTR